MPSDVTFIHPSYTAHEKQLRLVDDIYNGIDTARKHIGKLRNEYDDLYTERVEAATLDNFVERITTAMSGMVNRKPVAYEDVPENIIEAMNDINGENNLNQFNKNITEMAIKDGKTYILVDVPLMGGDPYFSNILRKQVTNWKKDENGLYTLVVIKESYEMPDGRYGFEVKPQYRVLDEVGNVEIWREVTSQGWIMAESIITSYNFCPFFEMDVEATPPLYDIAKINAKHMNFTSLRDRFLKEALDPILFGQNLGITDEGDKDNPTIIIGVNQMMNTDNENSNLSWVELDGSNYDVSEKHLEKLENDMAVRALKLQSDGSSTKTATQVAQENNESSSRLNDIASDLESTLNQAVNAYSLIRYSKELVGMIEVNRDFNSSIIDSNALTALNTLEVSNNITKRTLLKALNHSELVHIEDIDEEIDELEQLEADMTEIEDARIQQSPTKQA